MAGHNDPRLLYSIPNIHAHHVQNGEESPLTPSGPQTLSLLMVPTSSPFAGLSTADPQSHAPEEDFYLHLHLPPELDLPLPATTQIYHQPPRSYLIPRWDLGPESGAFTRIEFPPKVAQEDIDTFETILAQCTAFLERAPAPLGLEKTAGRDRKDHTPYNPQNYAPGQGYAHGGGPSGGSGTGRGQIVLVDEENGSVVGELSEGFQVVEDPNLKHGSKNPVEIRLPQDPSSNQISISPVSPDIHPAYKNSKLVSNAATASRLIVTTSSQITNVLQSGVDNFTTKTKPAPKPMTFQPTTHERVRKLHSFTQGAAGLSAKTVGQVGKYAQNLGASMARRGDKHHKGVDESGQPIDSYKPGLLNKSMMAFSTVADGIDQASRNLITSGSTAATVVVGHRYGEDARQIASGLTGGVKNVGLVYVDAVGVSRKAVVKSVAKGMVVGRVNGGGELVVGGGVGGIAPPVPQSSTQQHLAGNQDLPGTGQSGRSTPGANVVGFGNAPPPAYGSGVGEPLGGTALQGQNTPAKQ
ncbi:MAG: hypothetical protein M1837_007481 [Sclerophora amabilis]|nr:MAG: hypothetical protein M1837_007481 [Sclerophora amabilis]